jgi:hypothetical protein
MLSDREFEVSKEIRYEEISENVAKDVTKLRLLHFNDVYNIEGRDVDPCGGCELMNFFCLILILNFIHFSQIFEASRFISTLEHLVKDEPTLVFFSGDAFSPSNCKILFFPYKFFFFFNFFLFFIK